MEMTQSETAARLAGEKYQMPKQTDSFSPYQQDQIECCKMQQEAFIQGYTHDRWVSVEDRPLITTDEQGRWICTEDGDKEFMAAIPYQDNKKPGQELWWIHHCVIEDGTGLCVIGDDDNEPAGYSIEDVTYYMIIEPPKPLPT